MKSEKEKMLSGELYNPLDPQLLAERQRVRLLFKAFNDTGDDQQAERLRLLQEIIPMAGKELWIEPPFYCVILDTAPVTIGSNVWIGGGVMICPGVNIGDRSVIGAGSVVTKDIPAGVLGVGNPCRVVRAIEK
jgi:maltose O-acetyltransferase